MTTRSRRRRLLELFTAFILVTVLMSACQLNDSPSGDEPMPTATPNAAPVTTATATSPTPVAAQAQPLLPEPRPDAPAYAARGQFGVGYQALIDAAETASPLAVSSWYPALIPDGAVEEIAYEVAFKDVTWSPSSTPVVFGQALLKAEADGSAGPYPLIVLSHSFTGSTAGYSSLAEHYASHGFIVLAPEHSEQFDPELGDLWKALIDRPRDVTRTLDFAEQLTAPGGALSGLIDMDNVAVVGHSYGGYTALAMAGAQFDLEAFNARCEQLSEDDPASFLCAALVPNEAAMAERAGLDPMPDGLWPSFGDPRVTAIIPMAGDSYLFDEAGLSQITIPIMAMGGTGDFGTPYDWGAQPSFDYAASEQKALVGLAHAEHMIFATPCQYQPWMSEHPAYAYYCFDPVWDAERAQDLIQHLSTAFLLQTLTGDEAAHEALLPESVYFPGIEYTTTFE